MQSYTIMYVLLCSLHSICRFLFNYSIKVIVVLTTFSIISIPYLLNSVLQPYFMPIYSIILLYLFICNMSHVLGINYLILYYLINYSCMYVLGGSGAYASSADFFLKKWCSLVRFGIYFDQNLS